MKIRAVEHNIDLLASGPRSTGLHVSDLYNNLYADIDPKRYGGTDGPNTVKMAMGLAWETHLEKCLLRSGVNAQRPGEFVTSEGIAFNPDLYILNGHERGGEIKLTYMSEADTLDDPKFSKWHSQMKTYGHHLQLPQWRLYALFVNGDYRCNRNPILRTYDIEYSGREMKEEWTGLCNHGRHKGLL